MKILSALYQNFKLKIDVLDIPLFCFNSFTVLFKHTNFDRLVHMAYHVNNLQ